MLSGIFLFIGKCRDGGREGVYVKSVISSCCLEAIMGVLNITEQLHINAEKSLLDSIAVSIDLT